jgi:hypothetical protein
MMRLAVAAETKFEVASPKISERNVGVRQIYVGVDGADLVVNREQQPWIGGVGLEDIMG